MQIKWNDSKRSFIFKIKESSSIIEGRVIKQRKDLPFTLICEALKIDRKVVYDDSYFSKKMIFSEDEKLKLVKEKAIDIIKKELEKRKKVYEEILSTPYDKMINWNSNTGDIFYIAFSFMNGSKKICGSLTYFMDPKESFIELPWMGIRQPISSSATNEEELKEIAYEVIKQNCYEKLEILKNF